jgi:hypothetical protein
MNTRCKFKCESVTDHGESKSVNMTAVTYGPEAEDKEFWKWTPSGTFEINCLNPKVMFVPGKTYYLDISETETGA